MAIDLGTVFFDDRSVGLLEAKHLKKPSIWGPDLERAQFGAFFAKNALMTWGVFLENALI